MYQQKQRLPSVDAFSNPSSLQATKDSDWLQPSLQTGCHRSW